MTSGSFLSVSLSAKFWDKLRVTLLTLSLSLAAMVAPGRLVAQIDVLRVNTRLVEVDVVVRGDGRTVTDLVQEDFRIFDDGVEQIIAVFEVISGTDTTDATPLPAGVFSNRLDSRGQVPVSATAILVDRLNTSPLEQVYVDQQIRSFLKKADPRDHIAIYELSAGGVRIVQDYTGDPDLLLGAAEGMKLLQTWELPETGLENGVGLDGRLSDFLATGGTDPGADLERLRAAIYAEAVAVTTASALQTIARHMKDLPGRKSLVWMSSGFPITYNPQRHADFFNYDSRLTFEELEYIHQAVVRLIEENIAVYPVHAPGLTSSGYAGVDLMMNLAEMTGGFAFFNTNGLDDAIEEAVEDTRVSYRLGFYTADAEDDDFHSLKVEVLRRGVEVRHRSGYFGFGTSDSLVASTSMAELLTTALPPSSLGLLASAAVNENQDGFEVVMSLNVKDLNLELVDGYREGLVSLAMIYYEQEPPNGEGKVWVIEEEAIPIRLSEEEFEITLDTGFLVIRYIETEGRSGLLVLGVTEPSSGLAGLVSVPLGVE